MLSETFQDDQSDIPPDERDIWYNGPGWYVGISYTRDDYQIRGPFDSETEAQKQAQ